MLLTQPVPRHSSKHVLEEYNLKEHTTLRSKLKRKKRNERSSRQYFELQRRVLSFCAKNMNSKRLMKHLNMYSGDSRHKRKLIKQIKKKKKQENKRKLMSPNY